MNALTVTLPDGATRVASPGQPVSEVAEGISPRFAKQTLAAIVNKRMVDLSFPLETQALTRW